MEQPENAETVVHQAAFRWSEEAPAEHWKRVSLALETLVPRLLGVRRFTYGPDLELRQGTADFAVCGVFDDLDAYRAYADHPEHLAILNDLVLPFCADRTTVQYRPSGQ